MNNSKLAKNLGSASFSQVIAGIEDNQQADAKNQQGKQEAQAIQVQAKIQPEGWQPGHIQLGGFPFKHGGQEASQQQQAAHWSQCRQPDQQVAPGPATQEHQYCAQKRQSQQCDHH